MQSLERPDSDMMTRRVSNPERVRVAFVIHCLDTGGAERQLLQLISHLDRDIFEPLLIAGRPSGERGATYEADVTLSDASTSSLLSPLLFGRRIGKLAKTLSIFKPHILHAFLPERTLFMSAAAEVFHPVPVLIANRRSSVSVYRTKRWKTFAERLAMTRVDAMLTISKALREEVVNLDGFKKNVETIHIGVDTELFHPGARSELRREMGWRSENIVAGMVANFRPCKRHADFVTAAQILHQLHPEMRFVLMGNDRGTLEGVKQQIQALGLERVCRIISGSLKPELVYAALDLYVCSSESEGFGNAVLEAMACAKPVIATGVGGILEAIDSEVEGILIAPRNPGAIVAAAERFIGNPSLGVRMGAAARARVLARHSIAAMVRAHESFYIRTLQHLAPKSVYLPGIVDAHETRS
jgi:glycosyltransferase involved in cell wall biosynthesis